MKKIRIALLILIILINSICLTGCWNYREIDDVLIVAGIAVDKGTEDEYRLTAEIAQVSGGRDSKVTPKMITAQGKTMFDAVRNMISLSGKRLYWSHAKVIILSRQIAGEGITKVIDWYSRDSETRDNVYLLISEGETAKEIYDEEGTTEDIISFLLGDTIKNQVSLNKAPLTDILQYEIGSQSKGMPTVIPAVHLQQMGEKKAVQIIGTAIIKDDKLAGFLDGDETRAMNFIRNEVNGGLLVEKMHTDSGPALVSLEIFNNKTEVTPVTDGEKIQIDLRVKTIAAIDGIDGTDILIDEKEQTELEQNTQNSMKEQMQGLIQKIQSEYGADIFGFAQKLQEDKNQVWKRVEHNWEDVFKDLKVTVEMDLQIKNSGLLS